MRTFFLVVFLYIYTRIVGWTSSIKYIGEENLPEKPYIYIFWHSRLMILAYSHRGRGLYILDSTSKDGDVSAGVNVKFGHRIIRGTASRINEARRSVLKIIKALKDRKVIAITPDGPRGPNKKVKIGLPFISKKSSAPLVPVGSAVKRKKILNTWDNFIVPFPFNKCVVVTGKPISVKESEDLESAAIRIKKELDKVTYKADRICSKV